MHDLLHYFTHISDEVRGLFLVGGLAFFFFLESLAPLFKMDYSKLRHAGINAVYLSFRVPREYLDQFLLEAPRMGIRGLSITIPHKETVVPYLGKTDRVVDDIGAANTLVFSDEGIIGFNTDSRAAIDSLESNLKANVDDPLRNRTALVLGAGGAAKAVAYGLRRRAAGRAGPDGDLHRIRSQSRFRVSAGGAGICVQLSRTVGRIGIDLH